jgi:hypothetical protein
MEADTMDDATRSSYRYQISRSQQRINQLQDDRNALMRRIEHLELGKVELDQLRSMVQDDVVDTLSGLSLIPNTTSPNAIQQISPRVYEHQSIAWAQRNLHALDEARRSADVEIEEAWEAIRNIDSGIGQQHAAISRLCYQLSQ